MPSETEPQVGNLQIAPDKKKQKDKASGRELLGNWDWYWTLGTGSEETGHWVWNGSRRCCNVIRDGLLR